MHASCTHMSPYRAFQQVPPCERTNMPRRSIRTHQASDPATLNHYKELGAMAGLAPCLSLIGGDASACSEWPHTAHAACSVGRIATRHGCSTTAVSSPTTPPAPPVVALGFSLPARMLTRNRKGVRSRQLKGMNSARQLTWRTSGVAIVTSGGAGAR